MNIAKYTPRLPVAADDASADAECGACKAPLCIPFSVRMRIIHRQRLIDSIQGLRALDVADTKILQLAQSVLDSTKT